MVAKAVSLKKKITIGFLISAAIIAILTVFEYINFVEIKREIRYLETTDLVMRKALDLRRHETNYFFAKSPQQVAEESKAVHLCTKEMQDILAANPHIDWKDELALRDRLKKYEQRFDEVEASGESLTTAFDRIKPSYRNSAEFSLFMKSDFLHRPSDAADILETVFMLPPDHNLVTGLRKLDAEVGTLRKNGEDIVVIANDLDIEAREHAKTVTRVSQTAIIIFFPLFFIVGIGTLFFISGNVVRRLMLLIKIVEKAGTGWYMHLYDPPSKDNVRDEVGVLIDEFNTLQGQLARRDEELDRKNKELMRSKKLAAIGTLASGVAHELNNPLNNIYLSAQVLSKEAGGALPPAAREAVDDIEGETLRVKKIVGDLLEFARGKKPQLRDVELIGLIGSSYKRLSVSPQVLNGIRFSIDADPHRVYVQADPAQLEQVFINLFTNAVEAMHGEGDIRTSVRKSNGSVTVKVSDSGSGIPKDSLDKIFEPFFTTKDKGNGLGLAVVFNIIQKHNAGILVESEEGRGTTFIIVFSD